MLFDEHKFVFLLDSCKIISQRYVTNRKGDMILIKLKPLLCNGLSLIAHSISLIQFRLYF